MFEGLRSITKRIRQYVQRCLGYKKAASRIDTIVSDGFYPPSQLDRVMKVRQLQQDNNEKLNEMNEKIARTIRRIEEVKRRMANARANEYEMERRSVADKKQQDPMDKLKNRRLPKLPIREFSEFEDLHEFIKFNRMGKITEDEVQNCDWQETFKQLCE
ncbi:MAG: hypothetical protein RBU23_09200 [Candidatus Auribacterota bacterium]|jgi:hypothetical protein|nr:hypothetical protein [Candidatus Auribacterota bacterium]